MPLPPRPAPPRTRRADRRPQARRHPAPAHQPATRGQPRRHLRPPSCAGPSSACSPSPPPTTAASASTSPASPGRPAIRSPPRAARQAPATPSPAGNSPPGTASAAPLSTNGTSSGSSAPSAPTAPAGTSTTPASRPPAASRSVPPVPPAATAPENVRPRCHHQSQKAEHPRSPHPEPDHQHEVQCEARSFVTPVGHRADDLVFLAADRLGQADQLGDVVVAGAPEIEGEQPVPHVALARVEPVTRARRFSASRSFSFAIQAAAACWPAALASRVSMILANCSAVRCSRFRARRFLMPY